MNVVILSKDASPLNNNVKLFINEFVTFYDNVEINKNIYFNNEILLKDKDIKRTIEFHDCYIAKRNKIEATIRKVDMIVELHAIRLKDKRYNIIISASFYKKYNNRGGNIFTKMLACDSDIIISSLDEILLLYFNSNKYNYQPSNIVDECLKTGYAFQHNFMYY
ncbi:MAG: hypothetical protein QXL94_04045 [Candidatus Parvarchaeum sp.]